MHVPDCSKCDVGIGFPDRSSNADSSARMDEISAESESVCQMNALLAEDLHLRTGFGEFVQAPSPQRCRAPSVKPTREGLLRPFEVGLSCIQKHRL